MGRLAEQIDIDLGNGDLLPLTPTLRAALRLARDYQSFGSILIAVEEGSISVLSRVLGECGVSPSALPGLFSRPGASLAGRIRSLQPIAYRLVYQMLGIDPEAERSSDEAPPAPAERVSDVERFETLFAFATGILKWSPSEAWNATPGEIAAAAAFRRKVFAPKTDPKASKPHHELTIDEQADLLAAQLQARFGGKRDAS